MLIPPGETVVETKSCKSCGASFIITDKDVEFYDKVSPVFNGKKESIPTPTLCPDCRQRRRLAFRNERKLYKRKCDLTGKEIISGFEPDTPWPVYDTLVWYGDTQDYVKFGRDWDKSRSILDQLRELRDAVPQKSRNVQSTMENSDYCDNSWYCKNCYLCFNTGPAEDCCHCLTATDVSDCIDSYGIKNCRYCYECILCTDCSDVYFGGYSTGCTRGAYLWNCRDCKDCYMCANLVNRQYCIRNEQYSKEEYERTVSMLSMNGWCSETAEFFGRFPLPHAHLLNTESSIGENLQNVKDCVFTYLVHGSEHVRYSSDMAWAKDVMDCDIWWWEMTRCYENVVVGSWVDLILFSFDCWQNTSNLLYCFSCTHNVHDCFACVGLRDKQYCILNKQYTEAEYNALVSKIIENMREAGEWGEFLPSRLSLHGYQNSKAFDETPLTKEEALKLGFNWSDYEAPFPKVDKIIPASKLPEKIEDIPDDILNWAIECEVTKKPFRIIKQELDFYRKHNLPTPRRHPDQRHLDRLALRNPRKLFERKCDNCQKDMVTTYAPDRPERVYCEECYNKEVYG